MEQLWEITLGDLLDQMADKYPDHDCVIYHNRPFRKSYREFRDLVNLTAKGFLKMGIKKGIMCPSGRPTTQSGFWRCSLLPRSVQYWSPSIPIIRFLK